MQETKNRAQVLTEALPYIQKFFDKIIVVKYGGNAMINEELKNAVMRDIVLLSIVGIKVVLVHGGGPDISTMLKRVGKESKFIDGLRYTDKETAEIVGMVLSGKVNKSLVSIIHHNNGKAIGLCGADGGMIQAVKMKGNVDLGYVGEITKIDAAPIELAMDNGFIPVIATVGVDHEGQIYNINADTAAAAIAGALKAEKLISMTDIRGLLKDIKDEESLITRIKTTEIPKLIEEGIISGGMIPKIESCAEAIENGLKEAVIIDGRIKHSILIELFSDKGIGTLFY
ncbi:acetylglutamate kinase [Anaerovorax odorimutans]|uniref:acetylglutamate kinase n=1 Tax=Anaerovorax odorimutans TaxID=109327 RepID=UPI00040588ED|nr:acetylglutamate kinase [Anaerovorax odorimutans]